MPSLDLDFKVVHDKVEKIKTDFNNEIASIKNDLHELAKNSITTNRSFIEFKKDKRDFITKNSPTISIITISMVTLMSVVAICFMIKTTRICNFMQTVVSTKYIKKHESTNENQIQNTPHTPAIAPDAGDQWGQGWVSGSLVASGAPEAPVALVEPDTPAPPPSPVLSVMQVPPSERLQLE